MASGHPTVGKEEVPDDVASVLGTLIQVQLMPLRVLSAAPYLKTSFRRYVSAGLGIVEGDCQCPDRILTAFFRRKYICNRWEGTRRSDSVAVLKHFKQPEPLTISDLVIFSRR